MGIFPSLLLNLRQVEANQLRNPLILRVKLVQIISSLLKTHHRLLLLPHPSLQTTIPTPFQITTLLALTALRPDYVLL